MDKIMFLHVTHVPFLFTRINCNTSMGNLTYAHLSVEWN